VRLGVRLANRCRDGRAFLSFFRRSNNSPGSQNPRNRFFSRCPACHGRRLSFQRKSSPRPTFRHYTPPPNPRCASNVRHMGSVNKKSNDSSIEKFLGTHIRVFWCLALICALEVRCRRGPVVASLFERQIHATETDPPHRFIPTGLALVLLPVREPVFRRCAGVLHQGDGTSGQATPLGLKMMFTQRRIKRAHFLGPSHA
jgi:hypothetical protein